jgi:hypothetical protein
MGNPESSWVPPAAIDAALLRHAWMPGGLDNVL